MNEEEYVHETFARIYDSLTLFKMQLSSLQKQVKISEKEMLHRLKKKTRHQQKCQEGGECKKKRVASGFARPVCVSPELCEFMGVPLGSLVARTQVNKLLNAYIRDNKLVNKDAVTNKNIIVPDEKLMKLLNIPRDGSDVLTYFNIQKHMNKHFIYFG